MLLPDTTGGFVGQAGRVEMLYQRLLRWKDLDVVMPGGVACYAAAGPDRGR